MCSVLCVVAPVEVLSEGAVLRFLEENPNPDLGPNGSRLSATSNVPAADAVEEPEVMHTDKRVELAHIRLSQPGRGQGLTQLQSLVSSFFASWWLIFFRR